MANRKKQVRTSWTALETTDLLAAISHQHVLSGLDSKRLRGAEIFGLVLETIKEKGHDKTLEQIRCRWKVLKKEYYQSRKTNKGSGINRSEFRFYNELDAILGTRPMATGSSINGKVETNDVSEQNQLTGTVSSIKRDKKLSQLDVDQDGENEEQDEEEEEEEEQDSPMYPYVVYASSGQEANHEVMVKDQLGHCATTTSSTSVCVNTERERLNVEKEKLAIMKETWAHKKRLFKVTIDVMNLKRQKLELEVQQLKRSAFSCPTCNNH